jgi:hypothetical protein
MVFAEEVDMVYKSDGRGGGWHEPPYTWDEEMEFYRRYDAAMASGKATIYRSLPAAAEPPNKTTMIAKPRRLRP